MFYLCSAVTEIIILDMILYVTFYVAFIYLFYKEYFFYFQLGLKVMLQTPQLL